MMMINSTQSVTEYMRDQNKKGMWVLILVLVILLILVLRFFVFPQTPEEKSLANVGGGATINSYTPPLRKNMQCYKDSDCPDETTCNTHGICVPRVHQLPTSEVELKYGRGRGDGSDNTSKK